MPSVEYSKIEQAAGILRDAGAREVFLFGSAAYGDLGESSDVDMAVSGMPPARFFPALTRARRLLGRPLDLVDLDQQSPFVEHLKHAGVLRRVG